MNDDQVLDTLPIGLVVLDRSYRVRRWNHWMVMQSGLSQQTVLECSVFNYYPELNKPSFLRACKTVFTFGNVVYLSQKLHRFLFPFELPANHTSGLTHMQQSCTMSPVRGDDGHPQQVAITIQDVTDSVILERRLRAVNNIDELTGAYNRRYFSARLREEIERHRRYNHRLSLVIFDLDHFKQTNDSIGHLAGDHALIEIRKLAEEQLRDIDVLARFGGEEFVFLLPETGREAARGTAERLRSEIERFSLTWRERAFRVTASFGVAELNHGMGGETDLLEAADQALYVAKQKRNAVSVAGNSG